MNEASVLTYIASHKDLIERYGKDLEENFIALKNDFIDHGKERGTYFDPMLYLILNPAIFTKTQGNLLQATKHYIKCGFANADIISIEGIKPAILIEHEIIKENPEQYLLLLSEKIPNLSHLIEDTDRSIITPKVASDITFTILNLTPVFTPEVFNSLNEKYN